MGGVLELRAPGQSIRLDLAGDGRAISWRVGDHELLGAKSSAAVDYGMYAMGPWAGRIAKNEVVVDDVVVSLPPTHGPWALHGTVLDRPCRLMSLEQTDDDALAIVEVDLGPTWPWAGGLIASWHLTADGLDTTLSLNAKDEAFPGVIGWHPWFRRRIGEVDAEWTLADARLAERREDYSLTGNLVDVNAPAGTFDDAFRTSGSASIAWPGVLRLDIANSHPWFVVFDREADVLCVEPQSGPPNGVNDGLGDAIAWTRPGEPIELRTSWCVSGDADAPRRR